MKAEVRVVARSSKREVRRTGENTFKVYVHEPAVLGKANEAVIKILAEHFKVKKADIRILKGHKTKNKLIEIV